MSVCYLAPTAGHAGCANVEVPPNGHCFLVFITQGTIPNRGSYISQSIDTQRKWASLPRVCNLLNESDLNAGNFECQVHGLNGTRLAGNTCLICPVTVLYAAITLLNIGSVIKRGNLRTTT